MASELFEDLPKKDAKPVKGGHLKARAELKGHLEGKRFLFTVAQNNTKVHSEFWETLVRMSKKLEAKLYVAKLTYNKNGWQRITKFSETVDGTADSEGLWWDSRLSDYWLTEQVKVAPGLVFCGELDILPTAKMPLQGLDNYTGPSSAIVPHVKMQMQSLATMKGLPAKLMYTTGAVTLRNYIQRRAGQIAEFNHVFGALYVEVADDGTWFVRQLNSDENGIVYDLDRAWGPTWDCPASDFGRPYVNFGDVHVEKSKIAHLWTADNIIKTLNPEKVFLHDLLDMESRNHHNLHDPHFLVSTIGRSVEEDVALAAAQLLAWIEDFPDTQFCVVRSNHDEALQRWVKFGSKFTDPVNLRYWHELNTYALKAIEEKEDYDIFREALERAEPNLKKHRESSKRLRFIKEDESVILRGIEFGMHGHLGPNGSRPSPKSFRQLGCRANTGHTHAAGIIDGIWTAGVLGDLDMGYNSGPSSWSCSHIVTYPNGKRSIITHQNAKWRA